MSTRWPGGIINQTAPVPSGPYANSTAPGMWTLEQQAYLKQQGLWPTVGNINPDAFIENLFSTYLYTGNGSTQTIVNGIVLGNTGIATPQSTTSTPLRSDSNLNDFFSTSGNGIFATFAAGNYLQIDFGAAVTVSSTTYKNSVGSSWAPTSVKVRYSSNGTSWSDATTYSDNGTTNLQTITFSAQTAQYWQLYQNSATRQNEAGYEWHMNSFSMAGTGSGVGRGGLVWLKTRSAAANHFLFDTTRGALNEINSNTFDVQASLANSLTAFNTNGFNLGSAAGINASSDTYASWTFREQPKFFDIVTYTGNGDVFRSIPHNLGSVPGMIIVKALTRAEGSFVYHRSAGQNGEYQKVLTLTNNTAASNLNNFANTSYQTSTNFVLGDSNIATVNNAGTTYVAYLFAHNAGGFGASGNDNVISCGSFTTNSSGAFSVNLGYEPQYILAKKTNGTQAWFVWDVMRGWSQTQQDFLSPNNSNGEAFSTAYFPPNATGFSSIDDWFGANSEVIYMAIRRPMAVPTVATTVFSPVAWSGSPSQTLTPGFAPDLVIQNTSLDDTFPGGPLVGSRLQGNTKYLFTFDTGAEGTFSSWQFGLATGTFTQSITTGTLGPSIDYFFSRRPGFFDTVCYTGTGVAGRTVAHNLTVAPELMIIKSRSLNGTFWNVYAASLGNTQGIFINRTDAAFSYPNGWNNTSPTSTVFTVGTDSDVNGNGSTYVAYLFATCPGVSKVGSYTGTGATQTINCGFTGGARFVLIKRTNSTGSWWVWDTARGMVSGTDPRFQLNLQTTQLNNNWVFTTTGGFQIVTTDATVNASGGNYIFLAIA